MRTHALNQKYRIPETFALHILLAAPIYFLLVLVRLAISPGEPGDHTLLALAISLAGGLVLVVIPAVSPVLALVLLVLAGRSELGPVWVGLTDVGFLLIVGLLIVALRTLVMRNSGARWIRLNVHPLILGVCVFSIIYAVQFTTSPFTDYSLEKAVRVSFFVLILMWSTAHVVMHSHARNQFSAIYLALVGAMSGVALILAIAQHGLLGIQRITPIGGGPITLGRFTGFAALLCLAIFIRNGKKISLAGFIWFVGLTLLNGSRGPLLALILTVALLVVPPILVKSVRRRSGKLILFLWGASGALLAVFSLAVAVGAPFAGRYVLLFSGERGGAGVGLRLDWISQTGDFLRLAPAWGNGVGSWPQLTGTPSPNSYPHNIFTELLVENGLFVATFFIFLLVCAVLVGGKMLLSAKNPQQFSDAMIGVGLLVFSLIGAQVSGDLFDNRYIWVAIGWISALGYWQRVPKGLRSGIHAE